MGLMDDSFVKNCFRIMIGLATVIVVIFGLAFLWGMIRAMFG